MTEPLLHQRGSTRRRFGINPGPLKLRGEIPVADYNAGRCEALTGKEGPEDARPRCLRDARWVVTTNSRIEVHYCTQHLLSRGYHAGEPNVRAY